MKKAATAPEARLMCHVEMMPSGCWHFIGRLNGNGYGELVDVRTGRRVVALAHRVSYEKFCGPIGELHVLHRCDNRKCVNPSHLFLGTNADNVQDRTVKGRSNRPAGKLNGRAKLSDVSVAQIRMAAALGAPRADLRERFGVSKAQIARIINMKAWAA